MPCQGHYWQSGLWLWLAAVHVPVITGSICSWPRRGKWGEVFDQGASGGGGGDLYELSYRNVMYDPGAEGPRHWSGSCWVPTCRGRVTSGALRPRNMPHKQVNVPFGSLWRASRSDQHHYHVTFRTRPRLSTASKLGLLISNSDFCCSPDTKASILDTPRLICAFKVTAVTAQCT